jgi:DNA-binding CsgD family transcriptional regulator
MPRLSKSQAEARQRVLQAAESGLSPTRLAHQLVRAISGAVHLDGYRLFGIDSTTLLINRLFAASDNDHSARMHFLRDVYLRTDALHYSDLRGLIRAGLPAVALQEHQRTSWGYPRALISEISEHDHYRLYHEYRSPAGGALLANFTSNGRAVATLQAYRRDSSHPFRPTDVEFLRLMSPIAGQALALSIRREQAVAAPSTTPEASGILIVDGGGDVTFATPAGQAWSDLLSSEDGASEHGVATPIWSAIAELRSGRAMAGSIVATTKSGPIRIEASNGGEDRVVAVVISKEQPFALPGVPDEWPLTSTERRVVEQAIIGASNKSIAEALFVSEKTVEWHLWHVFEKLDVTSRSQLVSRFFQETLFPGVVEPPS